MVAFFAAAEFPAGETSKELSSAMVDGPSEQSGETTDAHEHTESRLLCDWVARRGRVIVTICRAGTFRRLRF